MIEIPLKVKYLNTGRSKFGGKKRGAGNSGGVGRVAKAVKRARVVGSRLKSIDQRPNQYNLWLRAVGEK